MYNEPLWNSLYWVSVACHGTPTANLKDLHGFWPRRKWSLRRVLSFLCLLPLHRALFPSALLPWSVTLVILLSSLLPYQPPFLLSVPFSFSPVSCSSSFSCFPLVLCVMPPLPVALKPVLESLTYTFPDFFSLPPVHSSILVISLFYSSSAMPEKLSKCLFQTTNQPKIWDFADKIINYLSSISLELTFLYLFFL